MRPGFLYSSMVSRILHTTTTTRPMVVAAAAMSFSSSSNNKNIRRIVAKSTELFKGTTIQRVIPQVACRSVGPFVFLDHFGPTSHSMNVGPHPHIGLCTLTYLYEGGVLHRDSTGAQQPILPNQVNWMYAGKGVTHSERPWLQGKMMHGLQLWVSLPKDQEDLDPIFHHSPTIVNVVDTESVKVKLVVGSALGYTQDKIPLVPGLEDMFLLSVEFQTSDAAVWTFPLPLGDDDDTMEIGLYVSSGSVIVNNDPDVLAVGEMMVITPGAGDPPSLTIQAKEPHTKVALLGGRPFPEKRHLLWNFCSWDTKKLKVAAEHWAKLDRSMFPPVAHESNDDSIPMPTKYTPK